MYHTKANSIRRNGLELKSSQYYISFLRGYKMTGDDDDGVLLLQPKKSTPIITVRKLQKR